MQVPLDAEARHAFAGVGRGREDLRRRPGLPPPRPVGAHRGRRLSRVGAGRCRSSPRSRPSSSASTSSTRPRSSRKSWCRCGRWAAWCSTATPTTSSPRPSRWRSARRTSCPGIDFSNDPLLAGRIHSYVDTQITRLGGPNFHEIPINSPIAQVHNNQRDGMHRQADPPRPRVVRAQLAGGRLPVPGRRRAGLRVRAGAHPRRGRAGQGARQAREVRRPLHPGARCSSTARRRWSRPTSPPPSASS